MITFDDYFDAEIDNQLGSLRFMPPVTVSPWRSLRLADRYSPVCPQQFPDISSNETETAKYIPHGRLEALKKMEPFLVNQSEDCLYLNIFTPYSSEYKSLPYFALPCSTSLLQFI